MVDTVDLPNHSGVTHRAWTSRTIPLLKKYPRGGDFQVFIFCQTKKLRSPFLVENQTDTRGGRFWGQVKSNTGLPSRSPEEEVTNF